MKTNQENFETELLRHARSKTYNRGQLIKVRGSVDTNLYFVESGLVRVFLIDDEEEHTIRFGYQNNTIAALDSFFSEKPSPYYLEALRKTVVRVIKKSDFMKLAYSSNESMTFYLQLLENLVTLMMEREHDLLITSPEMRYKRVLERSPQLFQEVPAKYIAAYLRMTPETLSRLKKS